MKRVLSIVLILSLILPHGGDLPPAAAEAQPAPEPEAAEAFVLIERGDGYTIEENASGLRKMTLRLDGEAPDPQREEDWTDQGGSWRNGGIIAQTELRKSYEKNETLVTLRRDGASVSFAPIQIEEEAGQSQAEVAPGRQVSENQTASNVLRIGVAGKGKPSRVEGSIRRGGRGSRGNGSGASPAVYEGLFDEHTDLHLTALSGGVKEDIVVNAYTGNHVYAFRMTLEGLRAEQRGQEVWLLTDAGEKEAVIPAPYMTDANGAYSEDIAVTLSADGVLTYAPSDAWLASPERVYPVTVDPTVFWAIGGDGNQGAYVFSNNRDSNFYNAQLRVGVSSRQTYVSFLLTPIPDILRSGALIDNVHLNLHSTGASPGTFYVHTVYQPWAPALVTWNTMPGYGGPSAEFYMGSNGHQYVDVTGIYCRWLDALHQGANHGIAITHASGNRGFHTFYSPRHGSLPPSFEVYYWPQAPVVTNLTARGYAYGPDSEEGWVDLTWDRIPGIKGYYVGIYTGKKDAQGNALYEYIYVGDTNNFTTRGKRLWPTPAQVEAGRFDLHLNGGGAELHAWPFAVYQNAGNEAYAGDLNYYFRVVPSNAHRQLPADANAATASVILPIDMPPSRPTKVVATPGSWTNADTVRIDWEGTLYYDVDAGVLTDDLAEGGWMEYTVDPDNLLDEAGMDWVETGSTLGTDHIVLSTMHDPLSGPLPPEEGLGDRGQGLGETGEPDGSEGAEPPEPAPWEDGVHLVLIRGVGKNGKTGRARAVPVYTDKTPPTAPDFTATPKSWSNAATAGFTWSGISDLTDLARVEWSADGETWYPTGRTAKAYIGHVQDTTMLADGRHILSLRGVDLAGNLGDVGQDDIWIDRNGPTVDDAGFLPGAYSAQNRIQFYWKGLKDAESGVASMGYGWGNDAPEPIDIGRIDGRIPFDVSQWADGPYFLTFERVDNIGNVATDVLQFYRDTVPPTAVLLAPIDGDFIGGTTEIWARIEDDTLDRWTLTAIRQNGERVLLAEGTDPQGADMLMMLDALRFDDGERVQLVLYAVDKAGNNTTDRVTVTAARIVPLPVGVHILVPVKGAVLAEPAVTGRYGIAYAGAEGSSTVYLNGGMEPPPVNRAFPIQAIRYPEDSSHTVAVISEDANGIVHYSEGLGARLLISDMLGQDGRSIARESGVVRTPAGIGAAAGAGEIESAEVGINRPMFGLRLHTREELNGGGIAYQYSTDGGASWLPVEPGRDVRFDAPQTRVRLRAQLSGGALLKTWDAEGVVEFNPVRFSVRLMRPTTAFRLDGGMVVRWSPWATI